MALYYSDTVQLRVMKPLPGSKLPGLYAVDNEDLNKFDFAHAKMFYHYDTATGTSITMLIDNTSYYP